MTAVTSSADLCRANGWGPGTRLVGKQRITPKSSPREHHNPRISEIEITAVGEKLVLAKRLRLNGRPLTGFEDTIHLLSDHWQLAS